MSLGRCLGKHTGSKGHTAAFMSTIICSLSNAETREESLPNQGVIISCTNENLTSNGKVNDCCLGIPRMASQSNDREVVGPT